MIVNNTSKFFKCFIIFLIYNIIIIFKVSCNNDYDEIDKYNKFVPDYDIIKENENNYYLYNLGHPKHVGQLKVLPKTFYRSLYNCNYIVLPELKDVGNNYDVYTNKIKDKMLKSIMNQYNDNYENIRNQENKLVNEYEKSYNATENAYKKVKEYEDYHSKENKKNKETAITDYLSSQMSEVSSTIYNDYCNSEGHTEYETYKNYEIYAEPTNEVYYCSNILKAKYEAIMKSKRCNNQILTEDEYDNITFLYLLLEMVINEKVSFSTIKIDVLVLLYNTHSNVDSDGIDKTLSHEEDNLNILKKLKSDGIDKTLSHEEDGIDKTLSHEEDDLNIFQKLKSEFVVNNENYMSYLVRMKIMGYVGFDLYYHKYMYKISLVYTSTNSIPVVDIHTELPSDAKELTTCNPNTI